MLDSIYHMTLKLFLKWRFWCENVKILPNNSKEVTVSFYNITHIYKPLVVNMAKVAICHFIVVCLLFQNQLFKKFFQEHYQSVKWFGYRSGLTFCLSWSGSKLFSKVISRRQVTTSKEIVNNLIVRNWWKISFAGELTLKAPIATKVVCFSRLLKCLRSLYGKQCGPRSDCSYRSSLFWVHTVCFYT